jgi:outer membrane protein assembly factor BamD
MKNLRMNLYIACAASILLLSGCGSSDKNKEATPDIPVETLYTDAEKFMGEKKYSDAVKLYEEVERQYPYSQYATEAQLMAGFAYYKAGRHDESILALDRFIDLHPGNENVDYAYYLKAMNYYEQISDVGRDQAMTRDAMDSLNTLIRRFPDSQYARDASLKRDLTLDHLAGKEMEVGRYYLNRKQINAALGRFTVVVRDYQTTAHVPEALYRLVEAYLILGLVDQSTRVAMVLGHNYPGSEWYNDAYKLLDDEQRRQIVENRGWVDRTVESLFKPN